MSGCGKITLGPAFGRRTKGASFYRYVGKSMEQRLAAVLAADMAGYSRLMEADEAGTIARLKTHRIELIDPAIAKNKGRIIKTTGDGMLVEFQSVTDAVRCAVEIQQRMQRRNSDVPQDRRIEFRIGINLGDIIFEDEDIFGDGVNIASRIEQLGRRGRYLCHRRCGNANRRSSSKSPSRIWARRR